MGIDFDSPCGPGAPCRAKLKAMEAAHQRALQELQEKHAREKKELEEKSGRMLQEECQAADKGWLISSIIQGMSQLEFIDLILIQAI